MCSLPLDPLKPLPPVGPFIPGRPLGPGDPIENSPAEARKVQKKNNHQLSGDLQIKTTTRFYISYDKDLLFCVSRFASYAIWVSDEEDPPLSISNWMSFKECQGNTS